MAKRGRKKRQEQLDLINVHPDNAAVIIKAARRYKEYQAERLAAEKEEVAAKQQVLALIQEANLERLEGGKIRFKYDGVMVTVTPRDELVQITEPKKPK